MTEGKKPIDWSGIERDFTKTDLSIREIAKWYGCSEKAIRLKAKEKGWSRPEGAPTAHQRPAESAEIQSLPALVEPIVERIRPQSSAPAPRAEDILARGRDLAMRMLDELDTATRYVGELEAEVEEAAPGKGNAKRRGAMYQVLSLGARSMVLKNLAQAAKTFAEAGAPQGKKAAAAEDAKTAGVGSDWGDDLAIPGALPN